MTKISKNDLLNVNWMDSLDPKVKSSNETISLKFPVCVSSVVDEKTIDSECSRIEKIASSNNDNIFYINGTWDDDVKSHLKEYALACGIKRDKIVEASKEQIIATKRSIVEAQKEKEMLKVASTQTDVEVNPEVEKISNVLKDPFKIDEKLDDDRNIHEDWEKISYAQILKDKPTTSGINAIRGGEDYNKNHSHKSANNQNSIFDSGKIEALANSEDVDVGQRIRQEKEEILQSRLSDQQKDRDAKLAEATEELSIMTIGNVFPTESLVAQPGIRGEMGGSLMDADSIPDQTKGEMLREINQEKTASIQRPKEEKDRSWEKVDNNIRTISDDFGEELSKLMGK